MRHRPAKIRSLRKAPRPPGRLQALFLALAWVAAGAGLMFGLSQLPNRLDTVLFFSTALRNITMGLLQLGAGLLQLLGALLLIILVATSLVLLTGGLLRLLRVFSPGSFGPDGLASRFRRGRHRPSGDEPPATPPSYLLDRHL
ncbi:MAG: hypothetical protein RLZZ158_2051 [Cyanobacteriota bacterium]|jgi:hypothetical protein